MVSSISLGQVHPSPGEGFSEDFSFLFLYQVEMTIRVSERTGSKQTIFLYFDNLYSNLIREKSELHFITQFFT